VTNTARLQPKTWNTFAVCACWVLANCAHPTTTTAPASAPENPSTAHEKEVPEESPTAPPPEIQCIEEFQVCFAQLGPSVVPLGAQAVDPNKPGYDVWSHPGERAPTTSPVASFWIQTTEVSRDAVNHCISQGFCEGVKPFDTGKEGEQNDLPATNLTYKEATSFCSSVGGRLPSEVEWEYAAHGSRYQRFAWGNYPSCPYRDGKTVEAVENRLESLASSCPDAIEAAQQTENQELLQEFREAGMRAVWLLEAEKIEKMCDDLRGSPPEEFLEGANTFVQGLISDWRTSRVVPQQCPKTLNSVQGGLASEPHQLYGLGGNASEIVIRDGGDSGEMKLILKGGSVFSHEPSEWRVAAAIPQFPEVRMPDVGFRCVREKAP
jgi:hypothetical protein